MKVNNTVFGNMRVNTYLTKNEIEERKSKTDKCSADVNVIEAKQKIKTETFIRDTAIKQASVGKWECSVQCVMSSSFEVVCQHTL